MSRAAPAPARVRELFCADADATAALGRRLGARLRGGDCVALEGPLGAGKTTLVQGLVAGLGSADRVTSPTFTLVNEYSTPTLTVFHVDLYRLADSPAAPDLALLASTLGLDDVLGAPDAVVLVEWADLLPGFLPADALRIVLSPAPEGGRSVRLIAEGARAAEIVDAIGS